MVENSKMTDSEIMLKVAGYDSKALEQLYDRYSPLLFTLIRKVVGDAKSAEEVLSDVFVIIWRKIDRFDFSAGNIYTWLVTLTRNKAVDVVRRSRGYENMLAYTDGYEDKFILPKISKEIKALELSEVLKKSSSIKDAISHLTDAQKYVIELSYYDGFDEKEIAKKLNIPFPTVKSKLLLALGILYKKLSDEPVADTKNKMIETIKAAVIGCLSNDELSAFNTTMESDENFLWKELGEYQNLSALIPAALTIELPTAGLKDNVARKLYRIKDEILAKQKKSIPVEVEEPAEKTAPVKEEKKTPLVTKDEGISFKEPNLSNIHIPSHREVEYSDDGTINYTESVETPFSDATYGRERSRPIPGKAGIDREIIEKTVKEYVSIYYQEELETIQKGMKRNLFISVAFFIILLILVALVFLKS